VTDPVEYLDVDDLVRLASRLLGDPPPIRDIGLLGSAAARPATTAFGEDAYPDLWTKAAALLQSIIKNHALVDGDKRLGWLATSVFLEINGLPVTSTSNDDVCDLVVAVAAGNLGVDEIAAGLRRISRPGGSRRGRRGGGRGG
jgi:death on curing protein